MEERYVVGPRSGLGLKLLRDVGIQAREAGGWGRAALHPRQEPASPSRQAGQSQAAPKQGEAL